MIVFKHMERLEKINKLIAENRTGTPDEFAQKVGVSRRQLYNYLDELRSYGIEVKYSRICHSFEYVNGRRLRIHFGFEELEKRQVNQVVGGFQIFSGAPFCFGTSGFVIAV